jgi:Predicted metal-binding, possibly nucleic acid-binding protein
MPLELNDIFVTPDSSIEVDECFEYDDLSAEGEQLVVSPVRVRGQVRNTGGLVELGYTAEFRYSKPCDRCLTVSEKSAVYHFTHTLALSAENDDTDDIIVTAGYTLDLFSLVRDDILLELPVKHLCSDDCRGLCPTCGQNLNEGGCSCAKKAVDPRMAVLDELLQD